MRDAAIQNASAVHMASVASSSSILAEPPICVMPIGFWKDAQAYHAHAGFVIIKSMCSSQRKTSERPSPIVADMLDEA